MRRFENAENSKSSLTLPGARRYQKLLQRILSQGLSPPQLAQAIAFGVTIGLLPTVWGTSLLCFVIAWSLRINHVAIQACNYFVYPFQIALFLPFSSLGQYIFPASFKDAEALTANIFTYNWANFDSGLWDLQISALIGWLVLALPCLLVVYLFTRLLCRSSTNS